MLTGFLLSARKRLSTRSLTGGLKKSMADYTEWRRLEQEFRDFETRHPNLHTSWISLDRRWTGVGGPSWERDGLHALCGIAAAVDGSETADPVSHWLNLVREYLLEENSRHLVARAHDRIVNPPGQRIGPQAKWTDPDVEHGEIHLIRPLCAACADYCLERARRALENSLPQSDVPLSTQEDRRTREERLQSFIRKHRVTIASVRRAAKVAKTDMQKWRKNTLSDTSVMSQRIERVLKENNGCLTRGKGALSPAPVKSRRTNYFRG